MNFWLSSFSVNSFVSAEVTVVVVIIIVCVQCLDAVISANRKPQTKSSTILVQSLYDDVCSCYHDVQMMTMDCG